MNRPDIALTHVEKALGYLDGQYRKDPSNLVVVDFVAIGHIALASALVDAGRPRDALPVVQRNRDLYQNVEPSPFQSQNLIGAEMTGLKVQGELGLQAEQELTRKHLRRLMSMGEQGRALGPLRVLWIARTIQAADPISEAAVIKRATTEGHMLIAESAAKNAPVPPSLVKLFYMTIAETHWSVAAANGDYVEVEKSLRRFTGNDFDKETWSDVANMRSKHAIALAKMGRPAEGRDELLPVMQMLSEHHAKGSTSHNLLMQMAQTTFGLGLADQPKGEAWFRQSEQFLAKMSPDWQKYRSVQLLRDQIAAERRKRGT